MCCISLEKLKNLVKEGKITEVQRQEIVEALFSESKTELVE